ncbi:MAG: dihydroorotase, partial [Acidobacteria bacterium]|nr:dihydroorotase [Acidobacteriota bacterium]
MPRSEQSPSFVSGLPVTACRWQRSRAEHGREPSTVQPPSIIALCLTLAGAFACAAPPASSPQRASATRTPEPATTYDVRIVHGRIIDGSGAPGVVADLGIRGDTIAAIGDLSKATSKVTIDATNQVITPGFIDLLGHSESSVIVDPHLEGKIR